MRRSSLRQACAIGTLYLFIGLATTALSSAGPVRVVRLSAWVASAIVFAVHVWRERVTAGASRRTAALAAALGVAIGGFGVALAANIHAMGTSASLSLRLSLIIWPIMLGVPALVAAWILAFALRPKASAAVS
jgi:hypothetical protein